MSNSGWLKRPNFKILSPLGAFSPYSSVPTRTDETDILSDFMTGETGSYLQATLRPLKKLTLASGVRTQSFAFGGHQTTTPRLSVRYSFGESASVHAAYAGYAQLPPYIYLLAYPQNRSLLPMRATHLIAGVDLGPANWAEIHVEGYRKRYKDMPAATEYPSVTLQSMSDLLGQQFVWLPMNSDGSGVSSGLEVSGVIHSRSRIMLRGSAAYSQTMSIGLDRRSRPSNYDLPWMLNLISNVQIGRGLDVSGRYGFATERPYTPYNLHDSVLQNRPIYDLDSVNAMRAPFYERLDMQISKDLSIRTSHLELYGGVDNLLNRSNFLTYAWMPLDRKPSAHGIPVKEIYQMPIFPNFGIRWILRWETNRFCSSQSPFTTVNRQS
jgi:TonB dependent receptor